MKILEPGFYYHICNHGNGFENLFLSDDNFRAYHNLKLADYYATKWGLNIKLKQL